MVLHPKWAAKEYGNERTVWQAHILGEAFLATVTASHAADSPLSQESKLEIPFLRHPESNAPTPFTFKQTLLFSSAMMSSSSSSMAGLRSHKVDFETSETSHEAKGYMSVQDDDREPRDAAWSEQLVRAVLGGWWAGERTGDMANKVRPTAIRLRRSSLTRARRAYSSL